MYKIILFISIFILFLLFIVFLLNKPIQENLNFERKFLIPYYNNNGIKIDKLNKLLVKKNKKLYYKNNFNPDKSRHNCINKFKTNKILNENNLPVPKMYLYNLNKSINYNISQIEKNINYPLVIKPIDGQQSKDVNVNIKNRNDMTKIIKKLLKKYNNIIIEKFLVGENYRIMVFRNKIIGILKLEKPYVIGNGRDSLKILINKFNDQKRINNHYIIHNIAYEYIKEQGFNITDIIPNNKKIILANINNYHNGSTLKSVNINSVHPDNIKMFKKVNNSLKLNLCGIDYISNNLSTSHKKTGAILEVNSKPDIKNHYITNKNHVSKFVNNIFIENNKKINSSLKEINIENKFVKKNNILIILILTTIIFLYKFTIY
jgi:cyanophycin synthetase